MKIAFYASDHGYGHATRTARFVQKYIQLFSDARFSIISGQAQVNVMQGILPEDERVSYRAVDKLDTGVLLDSKGLYDMTSTKTKAQNWIDNWDDQVNAEVAILSQENISMIFTDISPIGALVASKLGIKAIGVSNFTWVEQYEGILDTPYLDKLKEAYNKISLLLRYSLSMPIEWLTAHSLALSDFWSRPERNEKKITEIKKQFGNKKIVFIGFGAGYATDNEIDVTSVDAFFILSARANVTAKDYIRLNVVDDYYAYMSASDLIISKAGWGITNEAICAGVPVFLIKRDLPEDIWNMNEVERLGYGKAIEFNDIADEIKRFFD